METKTSNVPPLQVGACSERGPRPAYEDALLMLRESGVFAVADGLGSGGGGDRAALTAIENIELNAKRRPSGMGDLEFVQWLVAQADAAVRQVQRETPSLRCMTTITVVLVDSEMDEHRQFSGGAVAKGTFAWVGDSRLYLRRYGAAVQLTTDHRKPGTRGTLLRCLGSHHGELSARPDVGRIYLKPGDVLLLATDGVTDFLDARELGDMLFVAEGPDGVSTAQEVAEGCVGAALTSGTDDNCTAVVVALAEHRDEGSR